MKTVTGLKEWRQLKTSFVEGQSLGFVPTMGALHAGHASLFARARGANDLVAVSIFVNPTQFNQSEDFVNYPKNWAGDLEMAEAEGVDFLIAPMAEEIYHDNYAFQVAESKLSQTLEGTYRPGHFTGVLTVVLKLFNWVGPQRAYFGEKDYQQFLLIKRMAEALFLNVEVIACPTVRESSGLAMSSRNLRLSASQRLEQAPLLHHWLCRAASPKEAEQQLINLGFQVDYVAEDFGRRLAAVWLDGVRLIDNVDLGDVFGRSESQNDREQKKEFK